MRWVKPADERGSSFAKASTYAKASADRSADFRGGACVGVDEESLPFCDPYAAAEFGGGDAVVDEHLHEAIQLPSSAVGAAVW